MRAVIALVPTSNYSVASHGERSDQAGALATRLMGLSHPVQLISSARETAVEYDWPTPPRLSRQWFAVVTAHDQSTLDWRTRTLKNALEGVGLRCNETSRPLAASPPAGATDPGVARCYRASTSADVPAREPFGVT